MSDLFQDWLNDQCSSYVCWSEPEMQAAQVAFAGGLKIATTAERARILHILDTLTIREPTVEELMELELSAGPLEHAGEAWAWYRDEDLKDAIKETDDDAG